MEMPTPSVAPHIKPTDLKEFAKRTKAAINRNKTSGRRLEEKIGMATGTLSKLYGGRLRLSLKSLREIASALGLGPELLVQGTSLEHLLAGAPETPASVELLGAREETDRLRGEKAALEAAAENLQHEYRELANTERGLREQLLIAERNAARRDAEVERARKRTVEVEERLRVCERERREAVQAGRTATTNLQTMTARLAQFTQAVDAWRLHASHFEARARYLEVELAQAQAKAQKATSEEAGKLLLASMASLGIGVVLGDNSKPRKRS